ncbi:MAG TPA: DUF1194 domain-containing protein, partial [Stellaceae bacterium]|nr:DUF1194 domain-containing protein [Stellaceae bacterium]
MATLALGAPPAWSKDVDLALILAIDVSGSVNAERWELQRRGYEAAFNSPEVMQSITSGPHKSIVVTMVEWSGKSHQRQVVEWTVIDDQLSAATFASLMAEAPRVYSDWTSISAALDFVVPLFKETGVTASRNVIDVSGDGVSNQGRPIDDARADALAKGVVINGLPILSEYDALDGYYEDHVIGGAGAFMEVVKDYSTFSKAVLSKLVREIAGNEVRARAILANRAPGTAIQAAEAGGSGLMQMQPDSMVIATGLRPWPA